MEQLIVHIIIYLPEILSVAAILMVIQRFHFLKNAIRTFGEVTGIEERQNTRMGVSSTPGHRRVVHYPVIHFKDTANNKYRCIAGMAARFLNYGVGDRVPVIYNPSNPQKCFLNHIYFVWVTPLGCTLLAIGAIAYKYII
ncbi:DUF3592 domain-containing protein [Desulfosediminicola flagellatus]|uniref:DUF3592 domain-containing protein n=1 Tax=Desulfosediminicola flagellatus TaxID=2569541 RepID=UPI0010ABB742|nr:DUF3592 domain-containing protein [Desulfosediminicola flagellatus]